MLDTPYSATPSSAMHPLHEWDAVSSIVRVSSFRGAAKEQFHESLLRHGKSAVRTTSQPGLRRSCVGFLRSLFLPVGYSADQQASSVTPDYLNFQFFDTLQATSSYLRGTLCTHAVLSGLGVGEAGASATSAVLSWILRDGVGMVGGLIFTYLGAKSFGSNLKGWRLFADCINDVGLTLELISPLLPKDYFLPLLSAGCICRSMCGVAAGATRAALMQHFSKSGTNIADLSAKEHSQETIVTLAGMVLGALLVEAIDGPQRAAYTWMLFVALTIVHVYANWQGVAGLVLRSLNVQRTHLLANCFLHSNDRLTTPPMGADGKPTPAAAAAVAATVLSPSEIARKECLLWTDPSGIELGACFHETLMTLSKLDEMLALHHTAKSDSSASGEGAFPYLLVPSPSGRTIRILLDEHVTDRQLVRAIFHAICFRRRLRAVNHHPQWESDPWWSTRMVRRLAIYCDPHSWRARNPFRTRRPLPLATRTAAHEAAEETHQYFDAFYSGLQQKGWDTEHVILNAGDWRCDGAALQQRAETMPKDLYQF